MLDNNKVYMGLSLDNDNGAIGHVEMLLSQANRHGLIAGASGTGKTITMKVMAEAFSDAGVPVFLCDVKGDVSGIAEPGADSENMQKRIDRFGIRDTFAYKSYPVTFWDIYGKGGHPVRTTVSDMGPDILARILDLTDIQQGVLRIIFRIADDHGLKIIDMKDLRAVINYVSEHRSEFIVRYGNMATQSIGAISRALLTLEDEGAEQFFGEPALDLTDWIRCAPDGRGMINVLHSVEAIRYPKLYASFLLWMLAELYEALPEVGDCAKPVMAFFFDEAHFLFSDAPKALTEKIEQVVRLIRSKGVGVYFVTQSPSDIPEIILAQCSNRIQHALRAYTPAEQKAVRAAARAFRVNPLFDSEEALMSLGTGEALISLLDETGAPSVVSRTAVICPQSLMAPCSESTRAALIANSPFLYKYMNTVDNESAYEVLEKDAQKQAEADELARQKAELEAEKAAFERDKKKQLEEMEKAAAKEKEKQEKAAAKEKEKKEKAAERRRAKIETQLISAGGQLFKRGLFSILKLK